MDGAVVTRSHCSACPSFVSFRLALETATIGCDWGQDVAAWLRHEMSTPNGPARAGTASRVPAPRPPARRPAQPLTASAVGIFLAAFGVGLALSAWERPA